LPKGTIYHTESKTFRDRKTGALIRQITNHPSIHHHPFFFVPAYDNAMKFLIFISHRTGTPQIFGEERATGKLVQFTDRPDMDEWSVYPTRGGNFILFTASGFGWRLDIETLQETRLAEFGDDLDREEGMVGAAMGTTGLSWDDRWWVVPAKIGENYRLFLIDTECGGISVILEHDKIGHPQFCPDDNNLILYLATMTDPLWVINRKDSCNRRIYQRNAEKNEWITHAGWIPGRREVFFVDWPQGVRAINVDSGEERCVTSFNAWHAMCSPDGQKMVADTNFPDIGLQIFDPVDGVGEPALLCYSEASQLGDHWGGPFPYAKGPIKVYAPQHTHPHPSFAPGLSRVVYTSDRTGYAQVYECFLDEYRAD
jgi:oligogalacturonide lyase